MTLKNKRILITAGPTWVPIDKVRVIGNIATGETGILLAKKLKNLGAKVTLLLGPIGTCSLDKKINLIRFKYFDELKKIIVRELKSKKYDMVIHSAAVSDFRPRQKIKGKLPSDRSYSLKFVPLPKIIKDIRRLAPKTKVVMFKLESGVSDTILIGRAKKSLANADADFVVANRISPYRAFIIDKEGIIGGVLKNKLELAKRLLKLITYNL